MVNFICAECSVTESVATRKPKCDCGGLWKLDYTPKKFDLNLIDRSAWNIFRYREFMAIDGDHWRDITLGEGMSPIVNFDENVMLKMDYMMPTLSFKDRGAVMLVAHCKAIGVDSVVQDSSGNAGNSVAAYAGKAGIKCEIFVPEGTSDKKINMIKAHGSSVTITKGTRDMCADACRKKVTEDNIYYANHVYNPFFYEGTKTYIYETYEQLGRIPKNIFIPLGNGTLVIGVVKALEHLLESGVISEFPQIFAVQSEHCDPFLKAWLEKSDEPAKVTPVPTLAEGIAIGEPMRGKEILEYIYKYDMKVISINEGGILPAREVLARKGVYCEHTTAATYTAYLDYCKEHGELPDTLIPMCGAGLKSDK